MSKGQHEKLKTTTLFLKKMVWKISVSGEAPHNSSDEIYAAPEKIMNSLDNQGLFPQCSLNPLASIFLSQKLQTSTELTYE